MRLLEVYSFEGCPGEAPARALAERIAQQRDDVELRFVRVAAADAERLRFLGSPSIRVDGVDIEPGAHERDGFAMRCRVYAVDGRMQKVPAEQWLVRALASGQGSAS